MMKHGAMAVHLSRCHAGSEFGAWDVTMVFADWAAYGRTMDALLRDAEYQALFARVQRTAILTARSLHVGYDI
ncbi:MAG: hypothetical protein K2X74_02260 [Acetobacteraceae bacterium]|nr:hypothetical protein [Acetobacteraceae bacterium]